MLRGLQDRIGITRDQVFAERADIYFFLAQFGEAEFVARCAGGA